MSKTLSENADVTALEHKKLNAKQWLPLFFVGCLTVVLLIVGVLAWGSLMPKILHREKGGAAEVTTDGGEGSYSLGPNHALFVLKEATTDASRELGLSGQPALDQSHGMLFVFNEPSKTCFWMKDMQFNIDILWFDQDQKMFFYKQDATPASYPYESFCPPKPAKYVIEVAAGTVDRLSLKNGDSFGQPEPE